MPSAPPNTTLVQIGFTYGLNYPFVANNGASANQIFSFLPQGIAYALGISVDSVTMHALQPYDTTTHLGYVTTLAMFYIPTALVDTLIMDLRTGVSMLYANPDPSIATLMSMINPSIPILAGAALANAGGSMGTGSNGAPNGVDGSNGNPTAANAQANSNAAPLNLQQTTGHGSSGGTSGGPVRGASVGIAVGVVAGAILYAAAMIWVARRYKKRKLGHTRTSSVTQPMSQVGGGAFGGGSGNYGAMMGAGALMSGANGEAAFDDANRQSGASAGVVSGAGSGTGGSGSGRSGRTGPISAPVMAENSLGWH